MIKDSFYLITKVISDTEIEIDKPVNEIIKEVSPKWKIIPKLDQSGVYKEVCKRLSEGACLGIFPEGGSHDQTDLLPLKAGIALMAFETMIQYGIDVQIMSVGLNYFQGHRFRSKCLIEYGYPFQVPWEWADIFKQSRQKAIGLLLKELESNMRDVWTTAPSFKELKRVHTSRRIYVPQNMKLDAERSLQLSRRFSTGYRYFKQKYEGTPVFDSFTKQTDSYIQNLRNLGISDHQVTDRLSSKANFTLNIL